MTLLRLLLLMCIALPALHPAFCAPPQLGEDDRPLLRVETGGHTGRVMRVFFWNDRLVSVGGDKVIRVFRMGDGSLERVLRPPIGAGAGGSLQAAAFAPQSGHLAVSGFEGVGTDSRVRVFDLRTGEIVRVLTHPNNGIGDLAYSPDGKRLAACSDRKTPLWVWTVSTGAATDIGKKQGGVNKIAWTPDGSALLSGGEGSVVRRFEAATGKQIASLPCDSEVRSLAVSSRGDVAAGAEDGIVRVFKDGAASPLLLPAQPNPVTALGWAGSNALLSGDGERARPFAVRIFDVTRAVETAAVIRHRQTITDVAAAPDGVLCASADAEGVVLLSDCATGTVVRRFAPSADVPLTLAWGAGGRVVTWETTGANERRERFAFDLLNMVPAPPPEAALPFALPGVRAAIASDRLSAGVFREEKEVARLRVSQNVPAETLPSLVTLTPPRLMDSTDELRAVVVARRGEAFVGSVFSLARFAADGKRTAELIGHAGEITALAVSPDGRFLASASVDRTVRVWDAEATGRVVRPLVSLFQDAAGVWVAWTEEGYFAAAPGGDRVFGWHVNRGTDRAAQFYEASRFWRFFYRPDVLTRLLACGSVADALQVADAARFGDAVRPSDAALPALLSAASVAPAILSPADNSRTADKTATVRVRGKTGQRVRITVNGARTRGLDFSSSMTESEYTETVSLSPGENIVQAVTVAAGGLESAPSVVRIHCTIAEIAPPDLYVVAVGVSEYPPASGVPSLRFGAKDASRFANAWVAQTGRLFGRVGASVVLTDAQATRAAILDALAGVAKHPLKPQDYVVVFLAGHGGAADIANGDTGYCFLPADTKAARRRETSLSADALLSAASRFGCNVLLVLDTCRDGSTLGTFRADSPHLALSYLSGKYGVITLTACQPNERSEESDVWGGGAFTATLAELIAGSTGKPLTLADAERVLLLRVPALTMGRQNPRVDVPPDTALPKNRFLLAK